MDVTGLDAVSGGRRPPVNWRELMDFGDFGRRQATEDIGEISAKQPCCLPPSGASRRPHFSFFEAH
jgi:hypothetical protein